MITAFHDPAFFTLTCTALGLIVGSFLNVVILRLPKMMEQGWQRDCCEVLDQLLPFKSRSACRTLDRTARAAGRH